MANLPPSYAGGLVNRSVLRGSAVNWPLPAGTFTDPNGDPLGYTLLVERPGYWEAYLGPSNEPLERWIAPVWLAGSAAGLGVHASTGAITGTAWELTLPNAAGYERDKPFTYRVKLVASDGTASAEGLFEEQGSRTGKNRGRVVLPQVVQAWPLPAPETRNRGRVVLSHVNRGRATHPAKAAAGAAVPTADDLLGALEAESTEEGDL